MEQPTTLDQGQEPVVPSPELNQQANAAEQQETPAPAQQAPVQETQAESSADTERQEYADRIRSYYLKHGNIEPFLQAKSTDYSTLSPEEVLRMDLQKQYPTLSSERLDRLYKKEVLEKFSQIEGIFDKEDVELGAELMKIKADQVRARLIDEQKAFLQPVTEHAEAERRAAEEREKFTRYIAENDYIKQLQDLKRVEVALSDGVVNLDVDPDVIIEQTLDDNKFFSLFRDEKGGIDLKKWVKLVAYANNMDAFESSLANHGKASGAGNVIEGDLKNSSFRILPKPAVDSPSGDMDKIAKAFEAALSKSR